MNVSNTSSVYLTHPQGVFLSALLNYVDASYFVLTIDGNLLNVSEKLLEDIIKEPQDIFIFSMAHMA